MLNGDNKRCFSAEENILDQALWFVDYHNIKSKDGGKYSQVKRVETQSEACTEICQEMIILRGGGGLYI